MTSISNFTLPSTFGLACLLFIGLVFFIRASTKDRTEVVVYCSDLDDVELITSLQRHFSKRAYRVTGVDEALGEISLAGTVGASKFLAIFLGVLAGIGLFCLGLILTIALPQLGYTPYLLILLAPAASWFYWQGATREETVKFRLLPTETTVEENDVTSPTRLTVSAHRDELAVLESQVPLKRIGAE
jgi:hypothetical protein